MNLTVKFLLASIFLLCASTQSVRAADEVVAVAYQEINIPTRWEGLYIEDELLAPHFGDSKTEICFEAEFEDTSGEIGGAWGATGGGNLRRFISLHGSRDFAVVGRNVLTIMTPKSGRHIVTLKPGCRRDLRDAKHLIFNDSFPNERRDQCITSSGDVTFSVRNFLNKNDSVSPTKASSTQFRSCQIDQIFEWRGDFDLTGLVEASTAMRAEPEAKQ